MDVKTRVNLIQKIVKNDQYWLLAIGACLMAINLTLTWRAKPPEIFNLGLMFWATISFLIWERRQKLTLESDVLSTILGLLLIVFVLFRSVFSQSLGGLFYLLPVISALGLTLLASSIQGLRQYHREIIALALLGMCNLLREHFFDISLITAKFSAFMLWYIGLDVHRSGVVITLPTGIIRVYEGCSGLSQISDLLALALLFMLLFPQKWQQKIIISTVAVMIGFTVNAARVALMALAVRKDDAGIFEYWHSGTGSLIFSVVAAFIFGGFCWILLRRNEAEGESL